MIDIGLTKIAIIGVVALVVIGPEKLPKVARMAGTLFGRAQRYINQVKTEVGREIELDELRKMHKEVQGATEEMNQTMGQAESDLRAAFTGDDVLRNPLLETQTPDQMAMKVKIFRQKKLARTSALPAWYKRQSGHKTRVVSAAARVAKYRPASAARKSSAFFN